MKFLPTYVLQLFCSFNYALREIGMLPDSWYGADLELLKRGIHNRWWRF